MSFTITFTATGHTILILDKTGAAKQVVKALSDAGITPTVTRVATVDLLSTPAERKAAKAAKAAERKAAKAAKAAERKAPKATKSK